MADWSPLTRAEFDSLIREVYAAPVLEPFPSLAQPPATVIEYTVTIPIDDELRACLDECAGDDAAAVRLWVTRRGERARLALTARMLEQLGG